MSLNPFLHTNNSHFNILTLNMFLLYPIYKVHLAMHFVIPWWPWWSVSSISLRMGFGFRIHSPFIRNTVATWISARWDQYSIWDSPTLFWCSGQPLCEYCFSCTLSCNEYHHFSLPWCKEVRLPDKWRLSRLGLTLLWSVQSGESTETTSSAHQSWNSPVAQAEYLIHRFLCVHWSI